MTKPDVDRVLLAGALLFTGSTKLISWVFGTKLVGWVPESVMLGIAVVELVLGAALWTRLRRIAAFGATGLGAAFLVAIVVAEGRGWTRIACNCLGALPLGRVGQVCLALAILVLGASVAAIAPGRATRAADAS